MYLIYAYQALNHNNNNDLIWDMHVGLFTIPYWPLKVYCTYIAVVAVWEQRWLSAGFIHPNKV